MDYSFEDFIWKPRKKLAKPFAKVDDRRVGAAFEGVVPWPQPETF
jgi:hypothetical protein